MYFQSDLTFWIDNRYKTKEQIILNYCIRTSAQAQLAISSFRVVGLRKEKYLVSSIIEDCLIDLNMIKFA